MPTVPPLPPAAKAALITSAFHLSVSKYYALAATAMLVYDTIVTFDREVEAVWKSKWSAVKVLFFFNRYANFGAYLLELIAINSTWPANACRRYVHFPGIFNMVQQVVIGTILILFTWALFNRSKPVLAIAVVTLIVQLVVTGWSLGAVIAVPLPPGFAGCIYAGKKGSGIRVQTAWFMQLVFIAVVFGLMIWKAARLQRAEVKAPLITIFTRDGLKYFGVIFGVNFMNVMNFTLVKPVDLKSTHATFSALLTVVMISRLILSVREEATRQTLRGMNGTDVTPTSLMETTIHGRTADNTIGSKPKSQIQAVIGEAYEMS